MLHAGRIVPVYRLTAGLTAARLRVAMREALDRAGYAYPEYLPARSRRAAELPAIAGRARGGPLPADVRGAATRRSARLAFDELLALQLGMVGRRRARGRDQAPAPIAVDDADRRARSARRSRRRSSRTLGREVALTADQDVAIGAIRADLARPTPMLRLLQGDVGSGKTAVAAYALAAAARAGFQGALLAPTDLLARQHLDDASARCSRTSGVDVDAADRARSRPRERTARPRGDRVRPGVGRRRDARADPGGGRVRRASASSSSTSSTGSASSSAASSRPRPAAARRTSC